MRFKLLALALLTTLNLQAVTIGKAPKEVTISGDNGGIAKDSSAWSSSMIKDKVYVVFYVDPDEKDVNEAFNKALKAKNYKTKGDYSTIAIVNLAATWKPNFVIEKILASKQKEFPDTTYVKDKNKVLVKEWDLADDSSDILVFDKSGKVVFYKAGKMSDEDTQKAFKVIEENL